MTRKEAIEVYLSKNNTANKVILKIMEWEEGKSIVDNAKRQGTAYCAAQAFVIRFGLSWTRNPRRNGIITPKDSIIKLHSTGLSYSEIGRLLGCSRQRIEQIVKEGKNGLQTSNPRQQAQPII